MPLEPISADLLYRDCDVSQFEFTTTAELSDAMGLVGQDRALEAIRFGTRMDKSGYNIFALGPHGAGMRDGVIRHLQSIVGKRPVPGDWVYVNNFTDPNKPIALMTSAGRAEALRSGVADLIQDLRGSIPAILESEEYKKRLAAIDANYTQHQGQAFEALRIKAEAKNCLLYTSPSPRDA